MIMESPTIKYVDIVFQGKTGSLGITPEKVIFRPSLEDDGIIKDEEQAKPIARSWRWVAIEEVEAAVDPQVQDKAHDNTLRNSSRHSHNSAAAERTIIKLKAKGTKGKAVSLTVPQDVFDSVLKDLKMRLEAHKFQLEVDGQTTTKLLNGSSRNIVPASPKATGKQKQPQQSQNIPTTKGLRKLTGDLLSPSKHSLSQSQQANKPAKAITKRNSVPAAISIASPTARSPVGNNRRASMPAATKNSLKKGPELNPLLAAGGSYSRLSSSLNNHHIDDIIINDANTHQKPNNATKKLVSSIKSPLQKLKPKLKQALVSGGVINVDCEMIDSSSKSNHDSNKNKLDNGLSNHRSSTHSTTNNKKNRPLLHFLKAPPPRPSIAEELAGLEEEPATPTSAKLKRPISKQAGASVMVLESSVSSLMIEEAKAAQRLNDSEVDIEFTPTHTPKAKLNIDGLNAREMMDVFATPPVYAKEKVKVVVLATKRKQQQKQVTPKRDIAFTPPTSSEKLMLSQEQQQDLFSCSNDTLTSELSQEEYSHYVDDDSKSSEIPLKIANVKPKLKRKTKAPSKAATKTKQLHKHNPSPRHDSNDNGVLLWDPKAPENKFRMMALQHAATCQPVSGGSCPYDPICGEYRTILAHVETCHDDECASDKCQSTKKFLVTMQLMQDASGKPGHQQDYKDDSEKKDFLVSVGAVAPLSFVHVEHRTGKNTDNFSAISDLSGNKDRVNASKQYSLGKFSDSLTKLSSHKDRVIGSTKASFRRTSRGKEKSKEMDIM